MRSVSLQFQFAPKLNETALCGQHDSLGPAVYSQLRDNVFDVSPCGGLGDEEFSRDFLVSMTLRHQP
jgi:hypothetical protein